MSPLARLMQHSMAAHYHPDLNWEYHVIDLVASDNYTLTKVLDEHGKNGWELVSIHWCETGSRIAYAAVLKRTLNGAALEAP